MTVNGEIIMKSNQIITLTQLQDLVFSSARKEHLGLVKTKGHLRKQAYFSKLG